MKISLESIQACLGPVFGSRANMTGLIKKVTPDVTIPTCNINSEKEMKYNPEFCKKYIKTSAHLFCLLTHEMMHSLFGHLLTPADMISNCAADALINSIITRSFTAQSNSGVLFRELYSSPEHLECLLREDGVNIQKRSRYRLLYQFLYTSIDTNGNNPEKTLFTKPKSTLDICNAIRMLCPPDYQKTKRPLIGDHSGSHNFSKEEIGAIAEELSKKMLSEESSAAGLGGDLVQILKNVLNTAKQLKKSLLEKFADRHKLTVFLKEFKSDLRTTSPFPSSMSRRDMVLLANDIWPGYFHVNSTLLQEREDQSPLVTIYLDVSGSVDAHLPNILGVLDNISSSIGEIYTFSTECCSTTWENLRAGKISTTGGTCFNCVADNILSNKHKKVIIITDGYASLSADRINDLKSSNVKIFTILFGLIPRKPEFAQFGLCSELENVCD